MSGASTAIKQRVPQGVIFNLYPDSIGGRLADVVAMLERPEFEGAFSLLYVLPTFFNSDLDRGFSVIDYGLNRDLVSEDDLGALKRLGIALKLDLVLNHLSVASPQFQDLLARGDASEYRDFFVDWNAFWRGHGEMTAEGYVLPREEHLQKLFMRKPGLPILQIRFPDGSRRAYWNTFYQDIRYRELTPEDLADIPGLSHETALTVVAIVNEAIHTHQDPSQLDLEDLADFREGILAAVERNRVYLGQMDLNARSPKVWEFYDETLRRLKGYGAKLVRLDAFAYLHKAPGEANFFNRPGTWDYLERLKALAREHGLVVFPEIHSEHGHGLHEEVAGKGFPIYDFFFPGLVIDALDRGTNLHLLQWIREILDKDLQTINMLGSHDGIPVLDLRGGEIDGVPQPGLLDDEEIHEVIGRVIERGGRVKNLYSPDGRKIAYYQVNATFFSALGEDERKLRLARAIQMFMPGTPQVWYLDLFAGKNDYEAADAGGAASHKEINRSNLSVSAVDDGLKRLIVQDQLQLIRLRNQSPAFLGELDIGESEPHVLRLAWQYRDCRAALTADLRKYSFSITHEPPCGEPQLIAYT